MTGTLHHKFSQGLIAILLTLVMAAVTIAGELLISGYRNGVFGDTNENNTAYISLSEGFTNLTVKGKEGALHVASRFSKDLGLSNADAELKVDAVHTLGDMKYYRLQQYYENLPVFGRTVVIGADESGNSVSLNANTLSVSDKVSTEPKTSKEAAATVAEAAVAKASGSASVTTEALTEDSLCIYTFTKNGKDKLAYEVHCTTPEGSYKVFVDAERGTVLDLYVTTFGEHAICFDVEGKQLTASYNEKMQKYVLGDESQNVYVFSLEGKNYYEGATGSYVTSDDNIFGNSPEELEREYNKATKLFRNLTRIRRYYRTNYGAAGDKYLIGMYNDSYDNGNNSFATDDILWEGDLLPAGSMVGVISIGIRQSPDALDLLAHEYMHRVEQSSVGLLYRGESGSIMEAYSDVLGELVESGLTGNAPDWTHNGVRDLVHPAVHGYPEKYNGQYYVTDSSADNGAVHKNSTVLSHAAYLMWNGIDGTPAKKLDGHTLAMLWLNALQKFNVRETFQQCAETIYATARSMDLSREQVECVATAFKEAGLPVRDQDKGASSQETSTSTTVVSTSMADPSANPTEATKPSVPEAVGDKPTEVTEASVEATTALPTTAEPEEPLEEDTPSVG